MSSEEPTPMDLTQGRVSTPSPTEQNKPVPPPARFSNLGDLHIIGQPHETVLYHGDDVTNLRNQEENDDDDVYEVEVTKDDLKSMYRDLQAKRSSLEDAPFKGQKLRALEKETAVLKSLHDHPNTAVRVRFQDRTVIQGIFRTSATIGDVNSWLRQYLNDPALDFYIFTAPPKKILKDESKLVDEGLVAKVVIYFGTSNMPDDNKPLKTELYEKLSDPEKAFALAKDKLKVRSRGDGDDGDDDIQPSTETQLKDHPQQSSSTAAAAARRPVDKGKVPKWFKMK